MKTNFLEQTVENFLSSCQSKLSIGDLLQTLDAKKKLVLYGAGDCGRQTVELLRSKKRDVFCFLDRDPAKIGTNFCELPVVSFEYIRNIKKDCEILISNRTLRDSAYMLHNEGLLEITQGDIHRASDLETLDNDIASIKIDYDNKVRILRASVLLTGKCNFRCQHCRACSPFRSDFISKDEAIRAMKRWNEKIKPDEFTISGGEPLLHPDIDAIVCEAVECWKNSKVILMSNGLLLSQLKTELLEHLAGYAGLMIGVSLHLKSEEINAKIMQAIERIKKYGIPVETYPSNSAWWKYYQCNDQLIPVSADSDKHLAWRHCIVKVRCSSITDEYLYKCSTPLVIQRLRDNGIAAAHPNHPIYRHQGIRYDSSVEDILHYMKSGTIDACSFCPTHYEYVEPEQMKNG